MRFATASTVLPYPPSPLDLPQPARAPRLRGARRRWRLVVAALGLLALLPAVSLLLDNFHTVLPGRVYRSAQLTPARLERYIDAYGIRSIINLRGPNPGEAWYQRERALAIRKGVVYLDVPIDSIAPPEAELRALSATLRSCPKPVCLHCQSGIDRTGMAAAVAVIVLNPLPPPAEIMGQFSWRYGHIPFRATLARQKAVVLDAQDWLLSLHDDADKPQQANQ